MNTKFILSIFAALLCFQMFSQTGFEDLDTNEAYEANLNWFTNFELAKLEAKNTNKPILIYFTGSDWCAPCKMLKKDFFNTKEFEDKAKNMVLVLVDMPRRIDIITPEQKKINKALVAKYNLNGSYPNLVGLTKNLVTVGELSGYTLLRETDSHFQFVDNLINNYSN